MTAFIFPFPAHAMQMNHAESLGANNFRKSAEQYLPHTVMAVIKSEAYLAAAIEDLKTAGFPEMGLWLVLPSESTRHFGWIPQMQIQPQTSQYAHLPFPYSGFAAASGISGLSASGAGLLPMASRPLWHSLTRDLNIKKFLKRLGLGRITVNHYVRRLTQGCFMLGAEIRDPAEEERVREIFHARNALSISKGRLRNRRTV